MNVLLMFDFVLSMWLSCYHCVINVLLTLCCSSGPRSGSCSPSPDSYSLYCYPCTWGDCRASESARPLAPPGSNGAPGGGQPAQASWSDPWAYVEGGGRSTPLLSSDSAHKSYYSCPRLKPPPSQKRFAPFGALNPFANPGFSRSPPAAPGEWPEDCRRSPSPFEPCGGRSLSPGPAPGLDCALEPPPKPEEAPGLPPPPAPPRAVKESDGLLPRPAPPLSPAVARGAEGGVARAYLSQMSAEAPPPATPPRSGSDSPPPAPPPAWRPPADLSALSVEEVSHCLRFIGLPEDLLGLFARERIDGSIFVQLSEEILSDDFRLTKLHVKKIMQFIKGWRPKI